MTRELTVLGLSLLMGCSFIDDFEFETGDADVDASDAGDSDAAVDDGGSDGDGPEAGPDALTGDAGDAGTDGGAACEGNCYDALESFTEGGPWTFQRQDSDFELVDQADGVRHAVPSKVSPSGLPAHTACVEGSTGPCEGVRGWLLVETSDEATTDAAVTFTAPENGNYEFDLQRTRIGGMTFVRASRNRAWDDVRTLDSPQAIFNIDLLEGDSLRVVFAASDEPGIDAFRARATRTGGPRHCQSVIRFDDGLTIDCGFGTVEEAGYARGGADPDETLPARGILDGARNFTETAAIRITGESFDYSGDFTMQMWARVQFVDSFSSELFSDWSFTDPIGGVQFGLEPRNQADEDVDTVLVGYVTQPGLELDDCDENRCIGYIEYEIEGRNTWHFYRLVRDTENAEMRLCVDGQLIGTSPLPSDADLSPERDPHFGRQGRDPFEVPTFNGGLDDFRLINRALPCGD